MSKTPISDNETSTHPKPYIIDPCTFEFVYPEDRVSSENFSGPYIDPLTFEFRDHPKDKSEIYPGPYLDPNTFEFKK